MEIWQTSWMNSRWATDVGLVDGLGRGRGVRGGVVLAGLTHPDWPIWHQKQCKSSNQCAIMSHTDTDTGEKFPMFQSIQTRAEKALVSFNASNITSCESMNSAPPCYSVGNHQGEGGGAWLARQTQQQQQWPSQEKGAVPNVFSAPPNDSCWH